MKWELKCLKILQLKLQFSFFKNVLALHFADLLAPRDLILHPLLPKNSA